MFTDQNFYNNCLLTLYIIGPLTFIATLFLIAPYGKHKRSGWGPSIPPPLAWFLMESPTLWLTLFIFPFGHNFNNPLSFVLISPYIFHYINRTILYPLKLYKNSPHRKIKNPSPENQELRDGSPENQDRRRGSPENEGRRKTRVSPESGFPVSIALMAFGFNLLNAYVQARWVSHYADLRSDKWFWVRFSGGMVVFVSGMVMNVWADKVLVGLKSQGSGYKIPKGGLFEYVSCPNYLGEIVEWAGWALMTWSWAGLGFFLYTCANLVPRACANHAWYLEKFGEDYPRKRKAVIPFLY